MKGLEGEILCNIARGTNNLLMKAASGKQARFPYLAFDYL